MNPLLYRTIFTVVSVVSAELARTATRQTIKWFGDDPKDVPELKLCAPEKPSTNPRLNSAQIEELVEFVDSHHDARPTWSAVAEHFNRRWDYSRSKRSYQYYYLNAKPKQEPSEEQ